MYFHHQLPKHLKGTLLANGAYNTEDTLFQYFCISAVIWQSDTKTVVP